MSFTKSNGSKIACSSKKDRRAGKKIWPKYKLGIRSKKDKVINRVAYLKNQLRVIEEIDRIVDHPLPSWKPKKYLIKGVTVLTKSKDRVSIEKVCSSSKLTYGILQTS